MAILETFINNNVLSPATALVALLAAPWDVDHVNDGMNDLHEAAQGLRVALDYESPAMEAGLKRDEQGSIVPADNDEPGFWEDWQSACEAHGIDPHETPIHEHWIVTRHMAEALREQGETVALDFAGLCIWARRSCGTALSHDPAILAVHAACTIKP